MMEAELGEWEKQDKKCFAQHLIFTGFTGSTKKPRPS